MTASRLAALLDQATPGPWEAYGEWGSHLSNWWIDAPDVKTRRVPAPGHPDHDEAQLACLEADARLIALAPDMARLLVDMADYIREIGDALSMMDTTIGIEKERALLARLAALDEKAGGA